MSSTTSWSGVGLSPPGASSPIDSADSQSASTSPPVKAGPAPVLFDSRSFSSARPDLADEAVRFMSRLDGMPWMSATVLRGRSRFGFFPAARFFAAAAGRALGLAEAERFGPFFFGAAFIFGAGFLAEALLAGRAGFFAAFLTAFLAAFFFIVFFADVLAAGLAADFFLAFLAGFLRAIRPNPFEKPHAPDERDRNTAASLTVWR